MAFSTLIAASTAKNLYFSLHISIAYIQCLLNGRASLVDFHFDLPRQCLFVLGYRDLDHPFAEDGLYLAGVGVFSRAKVRKKGP